MKNIFFKITVLLVFFISGSNWAAPILSYPVLILNMDNSSALPKNFRMSTDILQTPLNPIHDVTLAALHASGSGQFSQLSLQELLNKIPSRNFLIIDLRQESHGFVNGVAVSWMGGRNWANLDKTAFEIKADEQGRLESLLKQGSALMHTKKLPHKVFGILVNDVMTEETLANMMGIEYIRIPVTDHLRPSDHIIDGFISLVRDLPESTWIHFHCGAGKGRTTAFLVMYDMLRNAKSVPFEDLLKRHAHIGGKDFTEPEEKTSWKYPFDAERFIFLKEFYKYCQEVDLGKEAWSDWMKKQEATP